MFLVLVSYKWPFMSQALHKFLKFSLLSLSLPIHLLTFYPASVFLVFVLTYNTCGVFTVIFWRSLTEMDLSNPAPITTKTQLKLDLCMKYTLNLIYFINQCVLVSHNWTGLTTVWTEVALVGSVQ